MSKQNKTVTRDEYIDSLKGVLIFLVVYGHILLGNFPAGSINCTLKNFIFMFHMPLFIYLSGMFSHIKDRMKYKKSIVRLLETYLFFQFIHYIIPLPHNYGTISVINYIVFPTWTMWYLVSLISWRIMIYVLGTEVLEKKKKLIILLSLMISLVSGFVPVSLHFSLQRTMGFIFFFVLGYYTKIAEIKDYVKRLPYTIAIAICLMALIGLYFLVGKDLGYITAGSSNYYVESNPLIALIMRVISFICAILLSLSIMRLTPSNKVLADIGKQTLFIYIIHSFVATAIFLAIRHNSMIGSPISLFILSACTTYILAMIAKTKLHFILNPLSIVVHSIINKKEK